MQNVYYVVVCACRWTSGKALPMSTYRKCLDRLTFDVLCWMPYGGHHAIREFELISCFFGHIRWSPIVVIHRPKRVVWQFGYVQTIPPHSPGSRLCLEDIGDRLMHYFEYLALVGQIYVVLGQCASDYIDQFYMILYPFMRPAQPKDLVRHPLVVQDYTYVEPDMPQYPVAATAHAASHVEQPRHAVVTYIFILLRISFYLNMQYV